MSATALCDLLVKVGAAEEQAEEAVKDLGFSNEAATKTDLIELKSDVQGGLSNLRVEISRLETKLLRWNIITAGVVIAAVSLITKM